MAEPNANVLAVFNALIEDEELLLDFWVAVEKAVRKSGVTSFSDDDRAALLVYMGEQAAKPEVKPRILKHFL